MALRNIFTEGDPVLASRAREVTEINDRIRMILDDLRDTMREADGVGLAAPQVGILRRMFVIEMDDQLIEMINPVVVETDGTQSNDEGCLSVPGLIGTVDRPAYVKMEGLDRYGEPVSVEGHDLLAVALCHEYDHLDGILYTQKAVDLRRADQELPEQEGGRR